MGEMGEGGQKVKDISFSYKISKSQGHNVQHGDYSLITLYYIFESC